MSRILVCGLCPLPFERARQSPGPGIRTWQLARGLASAGHDVSVLALKIAGAYGRSRPRTRERHEGVAIERFGDTGFGPELIARRLSRLRPDAVVGATIYGSYALARCEPDVPFWADQFGHVMAEAQAKALLERANWPLAHFWTHLAPVLQRADRISVVSSRQRFAAIGELGLAGRLNHQTCGHELVSVLPCALVPRPPRKSPGDLRGNLVPADAFVVFWSGGFNVWSDVDTLFEALELAMAASPRIFFLSTGGPLDGHDESTYERLRALVASSRFASRMHLAGWIEADALPRYEATADLGVLCEHPIYEGLLGSKNRIVQWMGQGLPVLYNRLGDLGDLLGDGQLGRTFPIAEPRAMADEILRAATDPQKLTAMADRAQAYAERELTFEATTRDLATWADAPAFAPDADLRARIAGPADFASPRRSSPTSRSGTGSRTGLIGALARRLGRLPEPRHPMFAFDPEFYLAAYPELVKAIEPGKAKEHYRRFGGAEGRSPNRWFDEAWYRDRYPDVAEAIRGGVVRCGFEHFVAGGYDEGRHPNPLWVHASWYFEQHPEVRTAVERGEFQSAYDHYLREGAAAGWDPHAAFAEHWYRAHHPDVARSLATGLYLSGYHHFMTGGLAEGRDPHPGWGEGFYRLMNPDVDRAMRDGELEHGYLHLVPKGLEEGRSWLRPPDDRPELEAATRLAHCRLEEFLASDRRLEVPRADRPTVSILLVLFNRAELTLACLESLRQLHGVAFEVVVVDNRSTDETRDLFDRVDGVRLILNDENEGFVRGANAAAAAARGELLLFLNNDTEVPPDSVRAAVERLRSDPVVGVVGGRVVGYDGRLQEAGSIVWRTGGTDGYGRGSDPWHGSYLFPREVDYCSGVFFLVRAADFSDLGGFDERYVPAYYEEADFCFRIRARGRSVVYEPDALIYHYGSASLPSGDALFEHLARNRPRFLAAHGDALEEAFPPAAIHFFQASDRRPLRGRVLVLDDKVPLEHLGAGFPRMEQILHALADLGWGVTFFATDPDPVDRRDVRRMYGERGIEIIDHSNREELESFWQERPGVYDVAVGSRFHNARLLLDTAPTDEAHRPRLIFDCEALASDRCAARREAGLDVDGEGAASREEELEVAAAADVVWAVSAETAQRLESAGARVRVVGHAVEPTPGSRGWEDRAGLLFVGRVTEPWNPNRDGLLWLLRSVWPLLRAAEPDLRLTVAGPGTGELASVDGVELLGPVPELAPLFDRHRVFAAPSRFGSGVPLKVLHAAAHGLPVVASERLARQLGWRPGVDLLSASWSPEAFAEAILSLYRDPDRWRAVRIAALARIQGEHRARDLRLAIVDSLQV